MKITRIVLLLFVSISLALVGNADEDKAASWTLLDVPGVWEEAPGGKFANYDGFAWYRCTVKVPVAWKDEDLSLTVQSIDNSHEAYFNGTKIGGAGSFPPKYKSGLSDRPTSYTVNHKLVRAGDYNVVAIRIYDQDGRGGFKGAAPILANETQAIGLKGPWQFRTGDDLAWAKPAEKAPTSAVFAKVEDAAFVHKRYYPKVGAKPLSAAEARKSFQVSDDLELEQVLAEPIVTQPLQVSFDERGRMWVVQYRQYPNPAGLTMLSRDKYWRSVYDKVPPPPPNHYKGLDKITIHEDTDGDGRYDKHTTFLEGLSIATSVARGRGGVWILNPPYLLFYADRNNDDVPDGPPEVHLEGFGLQDTHSVASNLCWGPDGWLYAAQGSTVAANIKRLGIDKTPVHSMGQLIWRYHPEKKIYEIYAEGGGNAFGVEVDSKGRVYSGHNGGNTRGFHYVQGGYYQKGFSKHGPISNPYAFGYFPYMKHADVPRFTHTFVIYEGGALPARHHGRLFGVAPLQSHVVESDVFADGSSFQTKDREHPITSSDTWFRPVHVAAGPDGALYVSDLYENHIAHLRHFEGLIDKDSGRIYRLQAKGAKPSLPADLSKLSSPELVKLLHSDNRWTRQTALRLLGDRKDRSLIPSLTRMVKENTGQVALDALWGLNLSGGFNEPLALDMLDHADPHVRAWTVRLLGDQKEVSSPVAAKLAQLARKEPHVEVRSQLACAARRLPGEAGLPIIRQLLSRDEDVGDIHLPLLLWWAIEAKAESDRGHVLRIFEGPAVWQLPLVENHLLDRLMRRYAQAGGRKNLLTCAQLLQMAPRTEQAKRLLDGFEQAYSGRSLANLPEELVKALAKRGGGSLTLRLRLGESEAVIKALQTVADVKADKKQRLALVQTLGEIKEKRSLPVLLKLAAAPGDDTLQQAALAALQPFNEPHIGAAVIAMHNGLSKDTRGMAQALLVTRKDWTMQLVEAVDAGRLEKTAVPLDLVRKMTIHRDDRLAELIGKHWGNVQGATTAQMQKRIEHYQKVVSDGVGSPYRGKKLFTATCAKCHTLFDRGGQIGPELTTYKRDDTPTLLLHIVNPSAELREGFESFLVHTHDGRALTGFLVEQDNRLVVLRTAEGQDLTIARDDIEQMRAVPQSIMPEGLLDAWSDDQVRDLFAYLRTQQPLND
jgi:putative heme-binding domain-containing protein